MCHWLLEQAGERHQELANCKTYKKSTPIMWASWAGSLSVVQLLVKHGADPRAHDSNGATAAHWASASGQLEVCRYLHSLGADFLETDTTGHTPLDYAILYDRQDIIGWLFFTFYTSDRDSPFLKKQETSWVTQHRLAP